MPEIRAEHLVASPSGIRALALKRDGTLVDEIAINEADNTVNINNAPNSAATASLDNGILVAERVGPSFE